MKLPKIDFKRFADSFKTRSFRVGGYSIASTAIVLAIAIVVNILVGALPVSMTQFDTTANEMFTLSDQTETLVSSLNKDVTVYWIVRDGYENTYVENLLDKYESLSSKLKVVRRDPEAYPTFAMQYTDTFSENSLVVVSEDRARYVDYNDNMYVMDMYTYYYEGVEEWSFCGEQALTSAIDYVISEDLPKIYTLTGHGEAALTESFSSALDNENVETAELSLLTLEAVPNDTDCILINTPQSDISEDEKSKLEEYLGNGGKMILITVPPQEGKLTNLDALMAGYGVAAADGIVVESDQNYYTWGTPYYLLPKLNNHAITSPLLSSDYRVVLPICQGLTVSDELREGVTVTKLLTTSDTAISKLSGYNMTTFEKEEGDIEGPFTLGVSIKETLDDDLSSQIIWIPCSLLLDESANSLVSGGNMDFFLNMINYLCEPEGNNISIRPKDLDMEYLTMNSATASYLSVLIVGIIPVAYLLFGVIVWFRRKRR